MVIRLLKSFLIGLLVILIIFIMWMILPRIWSSLNPEKPPVGYYFTPVTYAAIWLGIDKLADLEPAVPIILRKSKTLNIKILTGNPFSNIS